MNGMLKTIFVIDWPDDSFALCHYFVQNTKIPFSSQQQAKMAQFFHFTLTFMSLFCIPTYSGLCCHFPALGNMNAGEHGLKIATQTKLNHNSLVFQLNRPI